MTDPVTLPIERERRFAAPRGLDELRERAPVSRLRYPDGHIGWLVTSHALAREVLTDSRFSMMPARSLLNSAEKTATVVGTLEKDPAFRANFLRLDPPDHTRVRRLLAGLFTGRALEVHRPAIERIVAGRLDAMELQAPPCDLVEQFASRVTLLTHCALYGIPTADIPLLQHRAGVIVDGDATASEQIDGYWEFRQYLVQLVRHKRAHPGEDWTSHVANLGELSDDEIVGALVLLFDAGFETTTTMLALGTLALLCHPEQWELLVGDASLVRPAVDELLRYLSIFQYGAFTRTAREPVEIGGVVIEPGETLSVSLAAANRDPVRFDDPDVLDVTRKATGHLAFGHGVHMCLGQHQARLEMEIAFTALTQRFPNLSPAIPVEEVPLTGARHLIYTVQRLPVAW